eukprot:4576078-Pyramimonas_sp.AAC.1
MGGTYRRRHQEGAAKRRNVIRAAPLTSTSGRKERRLLHQLADERSGARCEGGCAIEYAVVYAVLYVVCGCVLSIGVGVPVGGAFDAAKPADVRFESARKCLFLGLDGGHQHHTRVRTKENVGQDFLEIVILVAAANHGGQKETPALLLLRDRPDLGDDNGASRLRPVDVHGGCRALIGREGGKGGREEG